MNIVIDASVVVKWLLKDPGNKADTEKATLVIESVLEGRVSAIQPTHWLVEVGAVLVRLSPDTAAEDVLMLGALGIPTTDDPVTLKRACEIAIGHGQHLFDTLYHAVALDVPDSILVTANERYRRRVMRLGHIVSLTDWPIPERSS